ncbi:MAG: hypothetical protein Kow00120_08050 [Anaerolineae bacterium]
MPPLRRSVRGGSARPGGIVGYPLDRLHEEVAFVAAGLGWGHDEILALTHAERARWVEQVNRINARHNRALSRQGETAQRV